MFNIDDPHICKLVMVGTKCNEVGVVIGSAAGPRGYVVNINNKVKATDHTPVSISLKCGLSVDGPLAALPVSKKLAMRILGMPDAQAKAAAKDSLPSLYLRGIAIELLATLRACKRELDSSSGGRCQSLPFPVAVIGATCYPNVYDAPADIESPVANGTAFRQITTLIVPIEFSAVLVEVDELPLLARKSGLWHRLPTTTGTQYFRNRHIITLLRVHLRQLYQLVCLVSNGRDNPSLPTSRPDHDSGASPAFQLACCWA
jgi:hypothetical protein